MKAGFIQHINQTSGISSSDLGLYFSALGETFKTQTRFNVSLHAVSGALSGSLFHSCSEVTHISLLLSLCIVLHFPLNNSVVYTHLGLILCNNRSLTVCILCIHILLQMVKVDEVNGK